MFIELSLVSLKSILYYTIEIQHMDYLTSWTIQGAHCGPSKLGTSFHTALPDEIQIDHFLMTDTQTHRLTLGKIFYTVSIKFPPGDHFLDNRLGGITDYGQKKAILTQYSIFPLSYGPETFSRT